MPKRATKQRAQRDKRQGKAASTQAGEFVREEIHHVREGKHGARNARQAVAIGLSKARRAGVKLPAPKRGSPSVRARAERELTKSPRKKSSRRRSRAVHRALEREPNSTASRSALSRQAGRAASRRSPSQRSRAARRAAKTKGPAARREAAKKAARAKGVAGRRRAARKAAKTRAKNR